MNSLCRFLVFTLVFLACAPGQAQEDTPELREVESPPLSELGVTVHSEEPGEETTDEPGEEASFHADDEAMLEAPAPDVVLDAIGAEFDYAAGITREGESATGDNAEESRGDPVRDYALRGMGGLFFVLALILVLFYLARRFGQHTPLLAGMRLGTVMGRVHLNPKATLLYVRTGGRVLVLGVTPQQISLITEFDETSFSAQEEPNAPIAPADTVSFVEALRSQSQQLSSPVPPAPDDELASLRGDLQRLQRYLREESHEK